MQPIICVLKATKVPRTAYPQQILFHMETFVLLYAVINSTAVKSMLADFSPAAQILSTYTTISKHTWTVSWQSKPNISHSCAHHKVCSIAKQFHHLCLLPRSHLLILPSHQVCHTFCCMLASVQLASHVLAFLQAWQVSVIEEQLEAIDAGPKHNH